MIIEGQQRLHGARVADSDTDAIAAEDALLRVSLGSADVRRIFVRHLMRTLTVLDTILPGLSPFQSRVPLMYIAKSCEQLVRGGTRFPKADGTYIQYAYEALVTSTKDWEPVPRPIRHTTLGYSMRINSARHAPKSRMTYEYLGSRLYRSRCSLLHGPLLSFELHLISKSYPSLYHWGTVMAVKSGH